MAEEVRLLSRAQTAEDIPVGGPSGGPGYAADGAEAWRVRENLVAVLTDAREAVGRISTALTREAAPCAEDLIRLEKWVRALDEAVTWLDAQGVPAREATVPAIVKALDRLQRRQADTTTRRRLATLTNLTGSPSVRDQLERLAEYVRGLLADRAWDVERRQVVHKLLAFGDLVDLISEPDGANDANRLLDCQRRGIPLPPVLDILWTMTAAGHVRRCPLSIDPPPGFRPETEKSLPENPADAVRGEADTMAPVEAAEVTPVEVAVEASSEGGAAVVGGEAVGEASPAPTRHLPGDKESKPPSGDTEAVPLSEGMAEEPDGIRAQVTRGDGDTPSLTGAPLGDARETRGLSTQDLRPAHEPSAHEPVAEEAGAAGVCVAGVEEIARATAVVDGLAGLVAGRRFGMAHAVAVAHGWTEARTWALRVAALGREVRPETGGCTSRLLAALDGHDFRAEPLTLSLAVPALLRVALITGEPRAGALLTDLSGRLDDHLGKLARHVGEQALRGTLLEAPLIGVLADVTELERRISAAREAAEQVLRRPRRLRFQRATSIAKQWLERDGLLGAPLSAAAEDDRGAGDTAREWVRRLSQPHEPDREIDAADRRYTRDHAGRPVEGSGRQDLVGLIRDTVAVVREWLEAVDAHDRHRSADRSWATEAIATLRCEVIAQRDEVLTGLADQARSPDPLVAAASTAAAASMAEIFDLLDGGTRLSKSEIPAEARLSPADVRPSLGEIPAEARPSRGEIPAELALTAELLKVPGAVLDPGTLRVTVPEESTARDLLDAADADWAGGFAAQIAAENYPVAREMTRLARDGRLPLGADDRAALSRPENDEVLAAALDRSRSELSARHAALVSDLRRARARNELTDEQEGDLALRLRRADPAATDDLSRVRRDLSAVEGDMSARRRESADRLRDQLDGLSERADIAPDDRARMASMIDAGELAAAEEHLFFLEKGEGMPVATDQPHLARFFPAVPDALPDGLTAAFRETVRRGGREPGVPVLDYSGLSADACAGAADAFDRWARLGGTRPEERAKLNQQELVQAMRLIGIETKRVQRREDLPRGRSRRFLELVGVSLTGRAMVPAFGSKLGTRNPRDGRLRVLLVWDRPTAELLMSWVDQDTSGDSVLVAHFGTMSADTRRALARRAIDTGAPVIVVDDALLAYVAANGSGRLETTMAVALPFSAVNPYVRRKRMLVAPEMFYGRDEERRDILDPEGTQVIFGGRGLGKSALLRECRDRFEREPERVAVHLELNVAADGGGLGAGAVWDRLRQSLVTAGVLTEVKPGTPAGEPSAAVREGVLSWLRYDSRRRLLILLDEADTFFESDASQHPTFHESHLLKGLVLESDLRAKVVFAGLHSVQRFARLAGKSPFSHLGKPVAIGPLRPQHAFDLIARPLGVLGFTIPDELVHRVLYHCSYQPFLLQMFGHRLIETMHARRMRGFGGPPYVITEADVEAVESDVELCHDITSAFRDTLNLDPRYNVIANVIAYHAHERGLDDRLTDAQLAEECRVWWPAGFRNLDAEAFRAYLSELAGLGVLRPDRSGVGWRLRSSNALGMIGSRTDVEAQLVRAESEAVPPEDIARQTRRALADGTRWPLTIAQVNDLLGDRVNQVRLVLGSAATGIGGVTATVREVVRELGGRFELTVAGARRQYTGALAGGEPGRRRLVLSDLAALGIEPDGCHESLRGAVEVLPTRDRATRSVILIADTKTLPFWMTVFTERPPEVGLVTLRRYDMTALRLCAVDAGRFGTEEELARLLAVTSGWPYLVERALSLSAREGREDEALRRISEELSAPRGRAELLNLVGVTADKTVAAAYDAIHPWMDSGPQTWGDLEAAADLGGAGAAGSAVDCLVALGLLDVDEDGRYRAEPLVAAAWPYRALDRGI